MPALCPWHAPLGRLSVPAAHLAAARGRASRSSPSQPKSSAPPPWHPSVQPPSSPVSYYKPKPCMHACPPQPNPAAAWDRASCPSACRLQATRHCCPSPAAASSVHTTCAGSYQLDCCQPTHARLPALQAHPGTAATAAAAAAAAAEPVHCYVADVGAAAGAPVPPEDVVEVLPRLDDGHASQSDRETSPQEAQGQSQVT